MTNFERKEPGIVNDVVGAFDGLPIVDRLHFVKNLICSKIDQANQPDLRKLLENTGPTLSLEIAEGILRDIIEDYGADPALALARFGGPTG
jgi:hypothetical protein